MGKVVRANRPSGVAASKASAGTVVTGHDRSLPGCGFEGRNASRIVDEYVANGGTDGVDDITVVGEVESDHGRAGRGPHGPRSLTSAGPQTVD